DWGSAIAFDGTNYLVAWTDDVNGSDIYGQFISKSGVLVGSNFVIDDSPYPSDNLLSISFDGSRYMVCFPDEVDSTNQKWDIYARFVTPSGTVSPERITICDAPGSQHFPCIAFDGINYLITWGDFLSSSEFVDSKGRFFNASGVPVDTAFIIFDTLEYKFPIGAPVIFGGYQYLTITTRALDWEFSEGDVYGAFVPPYTGIEEEPGDMEIADFILHQNAPNPLHTTTDIRFQVSGVNGESTHITLKIYDLFGRLVRTLVDERRESGNYVCIWDGIDDSGKEVSNGIYFMRFNSGVYNEARQLVIVR
ncbi:MAG: hypothetical protein KAT09_07000, partial [Candidatus Aegiribacteria sp.]|nr:hypothetical protein [Candidatus Aegiribacteria sp.]